MRKECWADAYVNGIDEGIFGGALPSERRLMGAILNISPLASFDQALKRLTQQ